MVENWDPTRGKSLDYNKILSEKKEEAETQSKIDSLLQQITQCLNEIHILEGRQDNILDLLGDDNVNFEQDRINHININENTFERQLLEKKASLQYLKDELAELSLKLKV